LGLCFLNYRRLSEAAEYTKLINVRAGMVALSALPPNMTDTAEVDDMLAAFLLTA